MSATPNNTGAEWSGLAPQASFSGPLQIGEGTQNALQALLAFACMQEQAAARRRKAPASHSSLDRGEDSKQTQFTLDEVLQLVAQRAVSITGADGVAIALADGDAIICRAAFGHIAPGPGIKLDANSGFSGACLRSSQTIRCDDSETDARVNPQVCRALGARSMVAVPLMAKQRVAGLLEAFATEPFGFNDSDVRSLSLLGELILAAIRPEEEDRLAEMAKRAIAEPFLTASQIPLRTEPAERAPTRFPESAVAAPIQSAALQPTACAALQPPVVPRVRSRIILDEKFEPVRLDATPKHEASVSPGISLPGPKEHEPEKKPEDIPVEAVLKALAGQALEPRRQLAGLTLIAALLVVAIGLGWGVWLKIRHAEQSISANTPPSLDSEVKTDEEEPRDGVLPTPEVTKPAAAPEITGLHHSSSTESSTIVVDLQDEVQYEQVSLDHPARTYFDLHNTQIAAAIAKRTIEIDDAFLKRVRMAQPVAGVTRVVLELKDQAEVSGVRLDSNPYRLTIEVHKGSPVEIVKASPMPMHKPSPEIGSKKAFEAQGVGAKEFAIVLDAGHGGWDLGTVGKKGLLEKDLVLDIVERLGKLLETKLGAQVIYTRQDDSYVPLEKRAEIANLSNADLFLSVHANYSDLSSARGVETYYTNTYFSVKARTAEDAAALTQVNWTGVDIRAKVTDSHRLASDVQQALIRGLITDNPDLRNRGVKEAQYVVLTGTQMPAVLTEVSFVSSPEDEDRLQNSEYRQQIAEALYRGVARYRDEIRHTNKLASAKPDPRS
jgi:N-acetylmuramoyl-L-alanine amidase